MVTKFNICSQALIDIDAETIASFTENTRSAEVAGIRYDSSKKYLLTIYPWNFTVKDIQLSRLVSTPIDENWDYEYTEPSDILKLKNIYDIEKYGSCVIKSLCFWCKYLHDKFDNKSIEYKHDIVDENNQLTCPRLTIC